MDALSEVVRFDAQVWMKLADDEPFSQLKAKFWMRDEEEEWPKSRGLVVEK